MKQKKRIKLFLAGLLFLFMFGFMPVQATDTIWVTVNNNYVQFDQPPILTNGRVLVPLRIIFEEMGASVHYDSGSKKITGTKDDTVVTLTVNSNVAYVNGSKVLLDVPAKTLNGRVLVPTRFIAESLGATVEWISSVKTVSITSPPSGTENLTGVVDLIYPENPTKKFLGRNNLKTIYGFRFLIMNLT